MGRDALFALQFLVRDHLAHFIFQICSLLNQKKIIRRWKYSFWIWIPSRHGKIFLFVLQVEDGWRKKEKYLFKNPRGQTAAWMKLLISIISLNSDQCSFNIAFTITKEIATSITCMHLASQETKVCVPWLEPFQTNCVMDVEKCTVPGH